MTKVGFFHSTILHFLVQVLRELLIVTKNYAAVTRKPLCQKATKTIHLSGRKKYCTYSGKVLPQKILDQKSLRQSYVYILHRLILYRYPLSNVNNL